MSRRRRRRSGRRNAARIPVGTDAGFMTPTGSVPVSGGFWGGASVSAAGATAAAAGLSPSASPDRRRRFRIAATRPCSGRKRCWLGCRLRTAREHRLGHGRARTHVARSCSRSCSDRRRWCIVTRSTLQPTCWWQPLRWRTGAVVRRRALACRGAGRDSAGAAPLGALSACSPALRQPTSQAPARSGIWSGTV